MTKKVRLEDGVPAVVIQGPIEEYCVKPLFDVDGVQVSAGILRNGKEEVDPVPFAPPVRVRAPDPLDVLIQQHIRRAVSEAAAANDFETFEEADDFEIEDDPLDELTQYERVFEPPPAPVQKPPPETQTPAAAADVSKPSVSPDQGSKLDMVSGSPDKSSGSSVQQ